MRKPLPNFDPLTAVHYHERDPGTGFSKDSHIAIDLDHPLDSERILTPNVIHVPSGGYRMYYTGLGPARRDPDALGYIVSAFSDDAVTWRKDPGVRVDLFPPYVSARTLCPDVIPLADGRYRMYFEARSHAPGSAGDRSFGPASQPTVIMSAVSSDGLAWVPEDGLRFGDGVWSYGTPRVIYIEQNGLIGYRMYFHRYTHPLTRGLDAGNHIISALSADGLTFEEEPGVRIRQETDRETYSVYAPEVVRLGDGSYRMYYSGWCDSIQGGVFTATSEDGLKWEKRTEPVIELEEGKWDSSMVSEPCVIDLDAGGARLFYECCDDDEHYRIVSATARVT
jgi:hypothetical protein